jgi:DNA gyrase/topoisomerase IV subunit A
MFEEESKNGNVPPPNLPFQPDDMLADVEKNDNAQTIASPPNALSAGVLKKKEVFDSDAQVPKERISVEQPSSYSMKVTDKTGALMGARVVTDDIEEIVAMSKKSQVIRVNLKEIPTLGRSTQGVRVMKLRDGDSLASLICL